MTSSRRPLILALTAVILLQSAFLPPARGDERTPVSLLWSSREDFEENLPARAGDTRRRNIDTAASPGELVLERKETGGRLMEEQRKIFDGTVQKESSALAFNPRTGEYMLVWRERRSGKHSVYARRLDAAGLPLGEEILVSDAPRSQSSPRIACSPRDNLFLVVWIDYGFGRSIRSRILTGEGTLSGREVVLNKDSKNPYLPDVAWNGAAKEFFVLWQALGGSQGFDLYATRVGTDGEPSSVEISLVSGPGSQQRARLAVDPSRGRYMVVWNDDSEGNENIVARIFDRKGVPALPLIEVCSHPARQDEARITFNGEDGEFLVLWHDYRGQSDADNSGMRNHFAPERGVDILGRRITGVGETPGQEITVTSELYNQLNAEVGFDPVLHQYLVVWQDGLRGYDHWNIQAQSLDRRGEKTGPLLDVSVARGSSRFPAVAYHSRREEFLLLWQHSAGGRKDEREIYVRRVGKIPEALGVLSGIVVDTGVPDPRWEGLYWNGDLPGKTAIMMRTRSAATLEELAETPWDPPLTEPGSPVTSPELRWIELGVGLETRDGKNSPALHSFTFKYLR